MTLIGAILKKVRSTDSVSSKYVSPPPEIEEIVVKKKKKVIDKYHHTRKSVDTSAPQYTPAMYRTLFVHRNRLKDLYADNMRLVLAIKKARLTGKVDDKWDKIPPRNKQYYENRANFFKRTHAVNRQMYQRISATGPRVVPTAYLRQDWLYNRNEMIRKAEAKFVLFPPVITEDTEDLAFLAPPEIKRPRVHLTLRVRGCAIMGELLVELFTDVCPDTCRLFLELVDGDGVGYGYVGTKFFRKVPGLYWSGGDVIYDNGFGCYAERGRTRPIGAQNYHFSHSMPGLLSMRVTKDDEMCGIFNITFKPLPQFDLRNEVFGRVIRPCSTFNSMREMGTFPGTHPVVELTASRRRKNARVIHGLPNTRIIDLRKRIIMNC